MLYFILRLFGIRLVFRVYRIVFINICFESYFIMRFMFFVWGID